MDTGKAALGGLDGNLAAALGYPIGIIALISIFMEKDNKFVKFHALQSIFFTIGTVVVLVVLQIILTISGFALSQISSTLGLLVSLLGFLLLFLWLAYVIALIIAAVKAYGGAEFKLPIVGNIAYNMANK
jgi:uncharacterized membrane protein